MPLFQEATERKILVECQRNQSNQLLTLLQIQMRYPVNMIMMDVFGNMKNILGKPTFFMMNDQSFRI